MSYHLDSLSHMSQPFSHSLLIIKWHILRNININRINSHFIFSYCDKLLCSLAFSSCLPFTSLPHNALVHTWVYCADSSQYRHMTRILKSQTWLGVSLVVLHAGDTACLCECCFSAIRSGTRNQWIQCSSHDRLQILRPQGLARQAFVALLLVLLFGALVY